MQWLDGTEDRSMGDKKTTGRLFGLSIFPALFVLMLFAYHDLTGPVVSERYTGSRSSLVSVFPDTPLQFSAFGGLSKGKFLVASRNIGDPRFSETVIFLVDYGPAGALGLVINRPTKVTLSMAFPEIEGLKRRNDVLFFGGPVRTDQMFMIVRSPDKPEDSYHVFNDVYVSGSKALLQGMIDKGNRGRRFRVFAGYSGWAAQQLDREVARGDWYVLPADAENIFEKEPSGIWPELFRKGSAKWVRLGRSGGESAQIIDEAFCYNKPS